MSSGALARSSLRCRTVPLTGAMRSLTLLTDSMSPQGSPASTVTPSPGRLTSTTSPREPWAKSVSPTRTRPPLALGRAHIWSWPYFRSAGVTGTGSSYRGVRQVAVRHRVLCSAGDFTPSDLVNLRSRIRTPGEGGVNEGVSAARGRRHGEDCERVRAHGGRDEQSCGGLAGPAAARAGRLRARRPGEHRPGVPGTHHPPDGRAGRLPVPAARP